jgi:hypothetical protein
MAGGIRTGVPIANSIRLNDDDSAKMSRTTGGSVDSRNIISIAFWYKPGNLGTNGSILDTYTNGSNFASIVFGVDYKILIYDIASGIDYGYHTDMLLRDPAAWYHIVILIDTTQGTEADRLAIYVNGVAIATTATYAAFPLNHNLRNWNSSITQSIGYYQNGGGYLDCYIAQFGIQDGVAGVISDYGEFNIEGHWIPKDVTGLDYGTDGFLLDFAVAPGTGNGAGTDVSGNANHFTDSG